MNEQETDDLIQKALTDESMLPEGLEQRLEEHIEKLEAREKQKSHWPLTIVMWTVGIAASLMLVVSIGIHGTKQTNETQTITIADTYSSPEEAAIVVKKTLAFVTEKIDKGLAQASIAEEKIQKVNNMMERLK